MLDKHAPQAAKNHLPLKLNRRQLLKSISLIGAGAGAAIADGFLRHKRGQVKAAPLKQSKGDSSPLETRDSIADIWGQRTP
jgi:hypothetical protein